MSGKQIIFLNEDNDRKQLALAWINIENDYDIITPYDETRKKFYGGISSNGVASKAISLINIKANNKIAIFESFIDFLTF